MKVTAFLKLCRVKHLIPVMFNIESLSDFIIQTIPPITSAEAEYFEKQHLQKTYSSETAPTQTPIVPLEKDQDGQENLLNGMPSGSGSNPKPRSDTEEPGLYFHEFCFLLGLIADRFMVCEEKDTPDIIERFFLERLNFKEPEVNMKNIMKFDVLLRSQYKKSKNSKMNNEPQAVLAPYKEDGMDSDGEGEFYTDDEECSSLESELDEE